MSQSADRDVDFKKKVRAEPLLEADGGDEEGPDAVEGDDVAAGEKKLTKQEKRELTGRHKWKQSLDDDGIIPHGSFLQLLHGTSSCQLSLQYSNNKIVFAVPCARCSAR